MAIYQSKGWSFHYYFGEYREALTLLSSELAAYVRQARGNLFMQKQPASDQERALDGQQQQLYLSVRKLSARSSVSLPSSSLSSNSASLFAVSPPQDHARPQECTRYISPSLEPPGNHQFSATTTTSPTIPAPRQQHNQIPTLSEDDSDYQPTTLKYGIVILSKLGNVSGLWIPSFTLDIKNGLQPSRLFVLFNYALLLVFYVVGVTVTKFVLEPSLVVILDRISKRLIQTINVSVFISEAGYIFYGLFSGAYIQYQRRFIQDFFLYKCSMITLPRCYQRRQIITLFLAFYWFAFTSEPLYALLSLYYDIQQPRLWANLNQDIFKMLKVATIIIISISSSLVSSLGILIPLMTCFLILASAKHLENTLDKQLVRCQHRSGDPSSDRMRQQKKSGHLEELLDQRTRKLMKDYSCETLTMDWPDLVNLLNEPTQREHSAATVVNPTCQPKASIASLSSLSSISGTSSARQRQQRQQSRRLTNFGNKLEHQQHQQQQLISAAGGLLFLYKNLLKNMSELKQMIRNYETKFAGIHFVNTLMNGLIVAQWITVAVIEARGISIEKAQSPTPSASSYNYISPFVLRIIGGVLTFILSNIYVIMLSDCLSRRVIKITSQLFKMNVDLSRSLVMAGNQLQQNQQLPIQQGLMLQAKLSLDSRAGSLLPSNINNNRLGVTSETRSIVYQSHHIQPQSSSPDSLPAEIDQIWSLYDQVERIGATTLFKFSPDTYYTKRCLLVIFGRSVSLLVLFIQIIDML